MDLSTLLAGPLGGVLGLGGAIFQKWLSMKEAKDGHAMKMEELKVVSQIDLQKADINLRQTTEETNGVLFGKAIDAQAALRPSSSIVTDIISLFRPGLTLALWVSSTVLSVCYRNEQPELMNFIITSTFGMFSISVGYWFGVRTEYKMAIRNVK
jgi:hypothetical protein